MTEIVSTRTSRSRRVVALMGWGCLVATAFLLWNARQTGSIRAVTAEPVAFILASFAAFVGVFAWMLFNPGRRSAAESPSLFFAAAATLFPPPIIGFCLMPLDSELRGWLALGLFLLCVIAVLSHVPDEFFGVPRGRHTYFTPIPAFDRVDAVLDPNSSWFRFEDLTRVVPDTERPSLAPRAYLQRDVARTAPVARAEVRTATEVDDILGSNFDLGLLDDSLLEDSLLDDDVHYTDRDRSSSGLRRSVLATPTTERSSVHDAIDVSSRYDSEPNRIVASRVDQSPQYQTLNPESQYLRTDQRRRREIARQHATRRSLSRYARHAQSLTQEPATVRGSLSRAVAQSAQPPVSLPSVTPSPLTQTRRPEPVRVERPQPTVSNQRVSQPVVNEPPAPVRRSQDSYRREVRTNEPTTRPTKMPQSVLTGSKAKAVTAASVAAASAAALAHATQNPAAITTPAPVEDSPVAAPRQLMGQAVKLERIVPKPKSDDASVRSESTRVETDRPARRSRYDEAQVQQRSQPATPVSPAQPAVAAAPVATPAEPQTGAAPKGATQPFQRTKDADGSELVEGVMRVHFDKGQKRANVHVPFSPPLAGMPEVECECVDGDDLRLKVPVRQSYGIRIEARRSKTDRPLDANIGFAAICEAE